MPSRSRPSPVAAPPYRVLDTRGWRRVLGVFAHPDDESFGPGGTLARLADQGIEVGVLTLTRGTASTLGVTGQSPDALGKRRVAELRQAARVLGVRIVDVLDFPDSELVHCPVEDLVRPIADVIARMRPDTLLTFAPGGVTGHPDHQAVSRAVQQAWDQRRRAFDGPARLVFWLVPIEIVDAVARDTGITLVSENGVAIWLYDVRAFLARQWAAIRVHASQSTPPPPVLLARLRAQAGWEYFMVLERTPLDAVPH